MKSEKQYKTRKRNVKTTFTKRIEENYEKYKQQGMKAKKLIVLTYRN